MFGIKDLMEQAQGLQAKITAIQEELAGKIVVGSAGGDMVTVRLTEPRKYIREN